MQAEDSREEMVTWEAVINSSITMLFEKAENGQKRTESRSSGSQFFYKYVVGFIQAQAEIITSYCY